SRRRHTRSKRDWSSDVCSSDLTVDFFVKYAVPFFGLTLVGVATLSTLALLFNRYCLLHVSIALSNQLPRLFILIHPPFFYIIVIVVSTIESGMHAKHPTFFNAKEMNLHI